MKSMLQQDLGALCCTDKVSFAYAQTPPDGQAPNVSVPLSPTPITTPARTQGTPQEP